MPFLAERALPSAVTGPCERAPFVRLADRYAALIAQGMSTEDLSRHPMRHVLTNVVGAREQVEVHVRELELKPGDRLLLCSDGLHEPLSPERIGTILGSEKDPRAAAARLVREALERGTRDNVTALVVEIGEPA